MKHQKLFSFLILLSACGEPVKYNSDKSNSGNIHYRYTVSYDENSDITTVTAAFYEGEKKSTEQNGVNESACSARISVPLEAGNSITFNDSLLTETHIGSIYQYAKKFQGFFDSGKFVRKDNEGNELVNKVSCPDKIGFPSIMTFNKNYELSFKWIGPPLSDRDNLLFSIIDSKGKEHRLAISIKDSTIINYPVNQTYADGAGTFHITREKRLIQEQKGKKADISLKYIAKPIPINIVSKPEQSDPPVVSAKSNPF